jgi:hypothetical protein
LRASTFFAASILACCFPLAALAEQTAAHDGHWRVDLETTVGKCPKAGSVVITIKSDRVTGMEPHDFEPWGYIDDTNTFVGHFNSGEKTVRANGQVKGSFAYGPWSSQTEYCGGRWTARKVD